MSLHEDFLAMDGALASKGVPPLTNWWRYGIGLWLVAYVTRSALQLFACVGRGAAKSTALYKLALFFTLFVYFDIPVGERHYAVILSRLKEEAAKGIAIIDAWLTLLGIPHNVAGDVIELEAFGQKRGIRVVAASVAAASGWRAYFVAKDERSKWPASGVDELDAQEIDTSAAAMTASHEYAPELSFGSAWAMGSSFHDAIMRGSDDRQIVLGPTPTWIAAPHISEESTHRKEREPRRWAREYRCEFQAGVLSAFVPELVDRATRVIIPTDWTAGERIVVIDPTAGASDTWAMCVACWRKQPGGAQSVLEISDVDGVSQAAQKSLSSDDMVNRSTRTAVRVGAETVHSDQFEKYSLASAYAKRSLSFVSHSWTAPLKERAVEHVRMWLRDGLLALPNHDRLRHELLAFEERIAPSGALTFRGRHGGHDDYAMLIMLAALVDIEGGLPGSPSGKRVAGIGLLEYYQQVVAEERGGPSPLIIEDTEMIEMIATGRVAGCSHVSSRLGTNYPIEGGRILAKPSDVTDLQLLGFIQQ